MLQKSLSAVDLHSFRRSAGSVIFWCPRLDLVQSGSHVARFEFGCHIFVHVDQDKGKRLENWVVLLIFCH